MVRLSDTYYGLSEDQMTVEVCVIRDGESNEPITVTLNTRESTPPDAVGKSGHISGYYLRGFIWSTKIF